MIDYYAGHGHLIMSSVISQLTAMRELLLPPDEILSYINSSCRSNNPLLQLIATSCTPQNWNTTLVTTHQPSYDTPPSLNHRVQTNNNNNNNNFTNRQQYTRYYKSLQYELYIFEYVQYTVRTVCSQMLLYSIIGSPLILCHNWELQKAKFNLKLAKLQ